ncbi:hypothetical protein PWG14_11145 (plasmid) [Chromobacterium amazonense]|nr:hypothetical protein [Chromobacterium amazonense]
MRLNDVVSTLDALLEPWRYKDYAPNGLQVEGRAEVGRIVSGPGATRTTPPMACKWKAGPRSAGL